VKHSPKGVPAMVKKDKTPSFEENLDQLQDIVEEIEKGELGLEATISKYEEAGKLIKTCREILDKAELKINKLIEDTDRTEPFEPEE
jgi:exodeoxyribonuclease VII small subunit